MTEDDFKNLCLGKIEPWQQEFYMIARVEWGKSWLRYLKYMDERIETAMGAEAKRPKNEKLLPPDQDNQFEVNEIRDMFGLTALEK